MQERFRGINPTELTPSNVDEFLSRFYNFYDGLVRTVYLTFVRQSDKRESGVARGVIVLLSAEDQNAAEDIGWSNVTLNVEAVSDFILVEGKATSVVLSRGLSIGFFQGKTYLSIDTEAKNLDEFMASSFLVVGERCVWTVSPYSEGSE